jgi:hypothetical protein
MDELTNEQAESILYESLADLLPNATQKTYEEFCGDCPKRKPNCFPCKTAQTIIKWNLSLLVAAKAKLN